MVGLPKILIVDDEVNILRAMKRVLRLYELDIIVTTSPEEALEMVKSTDIDLVISDQRMPTMEGIDLLTKIKELSPRTYRILMSAYSDIEVFIAAINSGNIFQYISKPWDNEQLIKVIINTINAKTEQDDENKILKYLSKDKSKWAFTISESRLTKIKELFNNIIHNDILNRDIINELLELEFNLDKPLFCCLINLNKKMKGDHEIIDADLKKEMIQLFSLLPNFIAWDSKGNIGLVYSLTEKSSYETISILMTRISDLLKNHYPNMQFVIGVSNINQGPDSLKNSYNQAFRALTTIESNNNTPTIQYYKDLGVNQLLTLLKGHPEINDFIDINLGKLIKYDEEKKGELVHTLEIFLKNNNNLKESADQLFIHPKTLVFRRNRIEEILAISLENYETRLALGIAIKLYKLI